MTPSSPVPSPVFADPDPGAFTSIPAACDRARIRDPFGHQLHTLLALLFLFLLPLATAPKDIAFAALLGWTLARLHHTWRIYRLMWRIPMVWAIVAWTLWNGVSFIWSDNRAQGFDEFGASRMFLLPLMLWPVLDRAPWLVMAALLGILGENGIQLLQQIGWVDLPSGEGGRLRGLVHPIKSGAWFAAAMLWHLSAVLNARGWWRWLSLVLLACAAAGLVATGSRGPWLAAAISLPLALVIIPMRRPRTRRAALLLGFAALGGAGVIWLAAGDRIQPRLEKALHESSLAREQQIYWTSAGLRLGLWSWAHEIFRQQPIIGAGIGDFALECAELPSFQNTCERATNAAFEEHVPGYAAARARGADVTALPKYKRGAKEAAQRLDYLTRDHAHSTYLHTLAQGGVVGGALLALMLGLLLIQCWRDRPDHPYADASFFVLVGWIVGAQFDCYELNGHQLGLLALLVALTMPLRPRIRYAFAARDGAHVNDDHVERGE